jgi:prepilin-type N-terminal cleavage/methylation domain-containing protein
MIIHIRNPDVRAQAGYTLAEVMIAVFLISVMMVSLYAGFWSGFAIAKMSRENLRATQILVQKLETVRIYNWSQINNPTNFLKTTFVDYYNPSGTNDNTYGTYYKGVVSVTTPTNLPSAYNTKMREISVKVFWTNYLQKPNTNVIVRSREMKTHYARYGMQDYLY